MAVATGSRLGPYEITSQIGAGGMGEVFRARDTRLKRDVALKILPESFASDPDRLARFQREAEVLASLSHPNIAGIYGLEDSNGIRALVMEFVEGETLADRIARGPVPIDEALPIAKQIAEALEAAHEQGIIHRDLKPANIKVTSDGRVKVLDFGLAKLTASSATSTTGPSPLTMSPTITSPAMGGTMVGALLGTAAYMSPEQAKGKPADKRSDIWAFGCVLYETLTGRRAFLGDDVADTLAAVLRGEIEFGRFPRQLPHVIRELLRRCLDRDATTRLRDVGEARVAIQKYLADPASAGATSIASSQPAARTSWLTVAAWLVATVAVALAAALAIGHLREQPSETSAVRFQILPPEQTNFVGAAILSPDGRRLAFEAPGSDGRLMLWVRSLDALDARPLPGTEGVVAGSFWSPDSRFLAFAVNGFPGRLKKVGTAGDPPQTLCEYNGGFRQGAWSAKGVILFGAAGSGLLRVSEAGGTPSSVTRLDASRQEILHAGAAFLPDGRHFLYHRASFVPEDSGIYVGSIDTTPEGQSITRLLAADSIPVYVPSSSSAGFLLFLRGRTLLAQPLDGQSQRLSGDAVPLAENVGTLGSYGWFSASTTGALAFRTGSATGATVDLLWFDRQGKRVGQLGPRANYSGGVQLSTDGSRVATTRSGGTAAGPVGLIDVRVWTAELSRGIFSRLYSGEGSEDSPAVSPDGHVAFSSTMNGAIGDLYWMPANGIGAPEPLLTKSPTVKHPNNFSPDGRFLIFDDHTAQRQDLWILPVGPRPGGDRKPIPFVVTPADETFGQFSPDGKWVAYSSDESGRREVYVQGFASDRVPAVAVGKWQISTAGGDKARWSRDGKELYYIAPDRKMMAVPVKLGPPFDPGLAVPLFDMKVTGFFAYDVSPDGRFLISTPSETDAPASSPVTIVLNWEAALKR